MVYKMYLKVREPFNTSICLDSLKRIFFWHMNKNGEGMFLISCPTTCTWSVSSNMTISVRLWWNYMYMLSEFQHDNLCTSLVKLHVHDQWVPTWQSLYVSGETTCTWSVSSNMKISEWQIHNTERVKCFYSTKINTKYL